MFTSLSAEDLALKVTFVEALDIASRAGFVALDLPMEELVKSKLSASAIQERYTGAGLRPGGWWLPVEFREGSDRYQADLRALPQAGSIAQTLGSPWCITWIWPFSDELDYDSNMKLHVDRLRPVARILREFGCKLGLEYVGPPSLRLGHKYEFISTMSETFQLIEKLELDNVGILLDCWQWYTSRGSAAELDNLEPGQVLYVHLNDAPAGRAIEAQIDDQRMLPGATGVIDVETFLNTLDRLGFDGPIAVEPYNADLNSLEPLQRALVARQSVDTVFKKAGLTSVLNR